MRIITFLVQLVKCNIWDHPPILCMGVSFSDGMYRRGHENVGWVFLFFMLDWLSLKFFFCISCWSVRSFYFPCSMGSLRALHCTRVLCRDAAKWWKFRSYFLMVRLCLPLWLQYFVSCWSGLCPTASYTTQLHLGRLFVQVHYLFIVSCNWLSQCQGFTLLVPPARSLQWQYCQV